MAIQNSKALRKGNNPTDMAAPVLENWIGLDPKSVIYPDDHHYTDTPRVFHSGPWN